MDIHIINRRHRLCIWHISAGRSHIYIQSKTGKLARNTAKVGIRVNKDKTKTTVKQKTQLDSDNKT